MFDITGAENTFDLPCTL